MVDDARSVPPARPTPPWRDRAFQLFWGGSGVSDLGSAVSTLLIPLLAVRTLHAGTFEVTALAAARRLPALVLILPAGVLIDRVRRRQVMLWCDAVSLLAIGSVPLVAVFTPVSLPQLYVVCLVAGASVVVFDVAAQSYLPSLVERNQLMDANGKLRAAETAADALGPTVGALLAAAFGIARAITADVLSYVASAASLLLIRTPEPDPAALAPAVRPTFRQAMGEGLRYVLATPPLRAVAACTTTANLGIGMVTSLEVLYLVRELHCSSTLVGVILGLGVLGGFLGSLAAQPIARRIGSARVLWLALIVPAPLLVLMPLATRGAGVWLYAVGWAAFNASGGVYNTGQVAFRQSQCPPHLLGRMNASLRWIVWSTAPVGPLVAGALGTTIGLRPTLWCGVAVLMLAGSWLLASPLRRMRDVPPPPASVAPAAPAPAPTPAPAPAAP